jgi:dipeptidase
MVASLPRSRNEPPLYFASLGSPCVGAFIPLFVEADIPGVLARSSEHPSEDSPWWQLKQLLVQVERDWSRHAPRVRAEMDRFEIRAERAAKGVAGAGPEVKTALMQGGVTELLELVGRLRREIS